MIYPCLVRWSFIVIVIKPWSQHIYQFIKSHLNCFHQFISNMDSQKVKITYVECWSRNSLSVIAEIKIKRLKNCLIMMHSSCITHCLCHHITFIFVFYASELHLALYCWSGPCLVETFGCWYHGYIFGFKSTVLPRNISTNAYHILERNADQW